MLQSGGRVPVTMSKIKSRKTTLYIFQHDTVKSGKVLEIRNDEVDVIIIVPKSSVYSL